MAQEIAVTYGSRVMGGAQDDTYLVHGAVETVGASYLEQSYRWHVLVNEATEAAFQTSCANLETDLRKINQAFVVTIGSTNFVNVSHTGNTGYLSRCDFEVVEEANTGRSRLYRCTASIGMPADASGKGGLVEASINVKPGNVGPGEFTLSGAYTATSGNSATDNYEAGGTGAEALATSYTGALTGTWERLDPSYQYEEENKRLTFVESWRRVGYNQASGELDNAAVKAQTIQIRRRETAPGDIAGASRLKELSVTYNAQLDRTQTTDPLGFYESTIRPHLLAEIEAAAESSVLALVDESPAPDLENNAISVSMVVLALGTSSIIQRRKSTTIYNEFGLVFVPVHGGGYLDAVKFNGPGIRYSVTTDDITRFGGSSGGGGAGAGGSVAGSNPYDPTITAGTSSGPVGSGGAFQGLTFFGNAGTVGEDFQAGVEFYSEDEGGGVGGGGGQNLRPDPNGDIIRTQSRSEPLTIGLPDLNMTITIESNVEVRRFATSAKSSGVNLGGGGSGGGGSAGTVTRS